MLCCRRVGYSWPWRTVSRRCRRGGHSHPVPDPRRPRLRGPQNLAGLAEAVGVTPATATRMCDRLCERPHSPQDRARRSAPAPGGVDDQGPVPGHAVTVRRRQEIARIMSEIPVENRHPRKALGRLASAAGEVPEQDWTTGWTCSGRGVLALPSGWRSPLRSLQARRPAGSRRRPTVANGSCSVWSSASPPASVRSSSTRHYGRRPICLGRDRRIHGAHAGRRGR